MSRPLCTQKLYPGKAPRSHSPLATAYRKDGPIHSWLYIKRCLTVLVCCRYAMSVGPKFGADLMAYPGDPSLFHAQFTVRVVEEEMPINPTALKASVRGSHAARKHLLLGSSLPGGGGARSLCACVGLRGLAGFASLLLSSLDCAGCVG